MSRPSSTSTAASSNNKSSSNNNNNKNKSSTGKPSDRLNAPTAAAFGPRRNLTTFQAAYETGLIPCRLEHGSVRHRLSWQQPVDSVDLDPLAVYLAQGLTESVHPYSFLSRQGLQELLASRRAASQLPGVLPKLVPHLKAALATSSSSSAKSSGGVGSSSLTAFSASLTACVLISGSVGPLLNPHLAALLPSVARAMVSGPQPVREAIVSALQQFELNGAPSALAIIKSRIPTYTAAV